jgi:RNA polymerase sigma-70 factor (ECF subfamily)
MNSPRDDPLLRDLAAGREQALAELYDRYATSLFRVARAMLADHAEAEDAVQDVFVSLVRARQSLAGIENVPAYLFRALRRAAARRVQRRIKQRQTLVEAAAQVVQSSTAEPPRCAERLERALAALPPAQRQVIALKFDGGLTFAQIGQVLDVSMNTAASRYRYALRKLRAALED